MKKSHGCMNLKGVIYVLGNSKNKYVKCDAYKCLENYMFYVTYKYTNLLDLYFKVKLKVILCVYFVKIWAFI